ncbi:MAG TPA: ATP-binding protein [Verrucomicrobiae bacterium]|nr:ATP-binding protein [Verrucomicrobiae bacterium]
MITVRSWAVYGMLAAILGALLGWQAAEHIRVSKQLHDRITDLAHGKADSCARLMRSRRFSGGVISTERLEGALSTLVDTNELRAVELLNNANQVVASAGDTNFNLPPDTEFEHAAYWSGATAILKYPIDLGTNLGTNMAAELVIPFEELKSMNSNRLAAASNNPVEPSSTSSNRPRFNLSKERPYWMTEDQYRTLIDSKSAHTFVVVMSAEKVLKDESADLWMRVIIGILGLGAVAGYAVAWRSMIQTSELQLRLVRASEQNLHLKELSLAAAGLAHETRNPLNIIRGLAQLVAKQDLIPPEIAAKSREIINETDRVTAQLNEFINYSRPREVRRAATDLSAVANEVARTLNYDLEEKKIKLEVLVESVVIEADEQLLRQVIFNLVLNAIQAVPPKGVIRIRASRRSNEEAFIEISDNGPGVAPENRGEIFKPYFTTHTEGTGLGLSVVQQIVLAHGWEIQCLANEPAGALFRISHVKLKL